MPTVFLALPFAVGFGLAEVASTFGTPFPQAPSVLDLVCVVAAAGDAPSSFV